MINSNFENILKNGDCFRRSKLALNGDDIKRMGYTEGRDVGYIIDLLLKAVIEDPYMNTRENLSRYILTIAEEKGFPKQ
jgi:tRNA nucleotidyltransferase (CCA-adding enzyme)